MSTYFFLDESGRLVPEEEKDARHLAARTGRWRLVPASENLFLLRRDEVDGTGRGLRAVLCGDLEGFEPMDLVSYLAHTRWTGSLAFVHRRTEKRIWVRDGRVVWASSNRPADRLGQVVRRLGLVSEEDLDRLLAEPQPEGTRLGQRLLAGGVVDPEDLEEALRRQVEHIFFSILLMETGVFFVYNDPADGEFAADLDLNWLLVEGLRRIDELHRLRGVVPGEGAYVVRRARDPSGLSDLQWRAWLSIDDRRTVAEIAEAAMLSEFDVTQALYELSEAGYVRISEEGPPGGFEAEAEMSEEIWEAARAFNVIFGDLHQDLEGAGYAEAYRTAVNAHLAQGDHGYPALFRGLGLDESGRFATMDLVANLAAVEDPAAADGVRYLADAMNELMFFALLQAGRLLPPELHHAVSRRAQLSYQLLARVAEAARVEPTEAPEPAAPAEPATDGAAEPSEDGPPRPSPRLVLGS